MFKYAITAVSKFLLFRTNRKKKVNRLKIKKGKKFFFQTAFSKSFKNVFCGNLNNSSHMLAKKEVNHEKMRKLNSHTKDLNKF